MKKPIVAKTVLQDKFWIVENQGQRVATISYNDDQYRLNTKEETLVFNSLRTLKRKFNFDIEFSSAETKQQQIDQLVHGYPCSSIPYNKLYDIKRKLPLFTKSHKSKSIYCAGYYIIRFDKGWVKSFCPKLITLERYLYHGPFKTEIEMRQELSNANSK
jgi:hypothetical protein